MIVLRVVRLEKVVHHCRMLSPSSSRIHSDEAHCTINTKLVMRTSPWVHKICLELYRPRFRWALLKTRMMSGWMVRKSRLSGAVTFHQGFHPTPNALFLKWKNNSLTRSVSHVQS